MSDETQHDPWATSLDEPGGDVVPEDALDEGDNDELDELLAEFDLEETESGDAVRVRDDFGKRYDDPYEVGLKDGMWVPVRILTAEVQEKHVPRLSSKTCVAKKDGKVVAVLFDKVEAAVKNGAQEVVGEVPLPYFICTVNHAAPRFHQRRWDWEIEAPVFTIKTALFKPQRNRTGYANENGRSLRVATGATATGDVVTDKDPAPEGRVNMHEVATRMVDTVVLAQVSIPQKKAKFRPRLDENKKEILVQVNPDSGVVVTVFRQPDDSGYVIVDSGEVWEGDENLLVDVGDNHFAIRDNSESGSPLTEQYFPDYINPPFLKLPERKVRVERSLPDQDRDAEPVYVDGEITLDTIGAVARGPVAGAQVDVMLRTGEVITATWFGTEWIEKLPDGGGMEQFVGDDAQEEALASM